MPDVYQLLRAVLFIDVSLLVFNMLPSYPLDGGQILRSLLWFVLGGARSLMVATVLGFVGVVGFFVLALWMRSVWFGAISVFMLMNCWGGLKHAQGLLRLARLPHGEDLPARAAGQRHRLALTGNAGSAGSRSTLSRTWPCVRTALRSSLQRCAWTAENNVPYRTGLLAPTRVLARQAAVIHGP
jgi:hypothetical protein